MTAPLMLLLDGNSLTIADVAAVAEGSRSVALAPAARERMRTTRAIVEGFVARGEVVYGVTTGFGKLSDIAIAPDQLAQLQVNLVRSHAAGVGPRLAVPTVRAMMLLRANVLAKGFSGARPELAELLCGMLEQRLHPQIPEQGSVGASGDLAPLAHLALALIGEGMLEHPAGVGQADAVLRAYGFAPVRLGPKEGLALINGTQAHTAVAALSLVEARRCWDAAHAAGALTLEALLGTPTAFDPRIHAARGQRGQQVSADRMLRLLANSEIRESHRDGDSRVQDAYALRCIPQVHGPVLQAIEFAESLVIPELNAATDNPLVFDDGTMLSGGNFHGQAAAMAMDVLAIAMTNLAVMSERRTDRLVHPDLNEGLPPFLTSTAHAQTVTLDVLYAFPAFARFHEPIAAELSECIADLRRVNEELWVIEDHLRDCERRADFGDAFTQAARSVYRLNDRRTDLKRQINRLVGSRSGEAKSHTTY